MRGQRLGIGWVDETGGLEPGGGDAAPAEEFELHAVAQHVPAAILLEIAVVSIRARDDRNVGVILKVPADARHVLHHVDVMVAQVIRWAQPREHQQLRRDQRPRRKDHLPRAARGVLGAGFVAIDHTHRAAILDQHALYRASQADRQLRVVLDRIKKGIGRRNPLAPIIGELEEPGAALALTVEIRVERLALRLKRLHEPSRHIVDMPRVRDRQRPVAAMQIVVELAVALKPLEMRQNRVPAPADGVVVAAQPFVPGVVILRPAAHIGLTVHGRAPAQHVALRDLGLAPAKLGLRGGFVGAKELGAVLEQFEHPRRHVEQRMAMVIPAFEQQHLGAPLDQPCGGHAARRSPADHDMIESLHHPPPQESRPPLIFGITKI